MISKLKILTVADWEAMPHGDGNRYEIIEGELFVSCSAGLTHQRVLANLITLFVFFLEKNPIGEFLPDVGVILSKFSAVIPDLVILLNEQRDTIITNDRLTGPPALVIEVVSPGSANSRRDRVDKLRLYSKHQVQEYWIVDPRKLTVEQYVLHGSSLKLSQTLQREEKRLSSTAIPDFSCLLSQIFRHFGKR
jgi:Uma2 family endonuclease